MNKIKRPCSMGLWSSVKFNELVEEWQISLECTVIDQKIVVKVPKLNDGILLFILRSSSKVNENFSKEGS